MPLVRQEKIKVSASAVLGNNRRPFERIPVSREGREERPPFLGRSEPRYERLCYGTFSSLPNESQFGKFGKIHTLGEESSAEPGVRGSFDFVQESDQLPPFRELFLSESRQELALERTVLFFERVPQRLLDD